MTSQRLIMKGRNEKTIVRPLYDLKPIFHINYQINSITAFVHKRVTIPGGGTPLYKTKGMDFAPFLSENGYRICTFRSGIGYVLRGERRKRLNVLVVSFPDHKKRRNES